MLAKNSATDYDTGWTDKHDVPTGGTAGQTLTKNSATNYDASWATQSAAAPAWRIDLTRTLPNNVGDAVQLGTLVASRGLLRVTVGWDDGSNAGTRMFEVPVTRNFPSNFGQAVLPIQRRTNGSTAVDILLFFSGNTTNQLIMSLTRVTGTALPGLALDVTLEYYGAGTPTWTPASGVGGGADYFDATHGYMSAVSRRRPYTSVNANYTLTRDDDVILVDATSAAVQLTFLRSRDALGTIVTVMKTDTSANAVTFKDNWGDDFRGTNTLTTQYQAVTWMSVGNYWLAIAAGGNLAYRDRTFLFTTDSTYDIGASGASRPRGIFIGTAGITSAGGLLISGAITFSPDSSYDIGASGASRPRTIYPGSGGIIFSGPITLNTGAGPFLGVYQGTGAGDLKVGTIMVGTAYATASPADGINIQVGSLYTAGTKVVGTRRTGWAAATGTATRTTYATTTVTLPQLAERVKALIDDLIAHGLIGT